MPTLQTKRPVDGPADSVVMNELTIAAMGVSAAAAKKVFIPVVFVGKRFFYQPASVTTLLRIENVAAFRTRHVTFYGKHAILIADHENLLHGLDR